MTQIGVQLHTFRDVDDEYPAILRRVVESGYQGVEFAHEIHDADTRAVAAVLSETGLAPIGAHVELPHLEREFESLVELDSRRPFRTRFPNHNHSYYYRVLPENCTFMSCRVL